MKNGTLANIESNCRSGEFSDELIANRSKDAKREPLTLQGTQSIAISSTFTADLLQRPLTFWMKTLDIPAAITLAPYAQVMQELLDPQSLLSQNKHGFNVLLLRLEDWIRDRRTESIERNIEHIRQMADELMAGVEILRTRTNIPLCIFLCPASSSLPVALRESLQAIQADVIAHLNARTRVHLWTHEDLVRLYPILSYEDTRADRLGHIPYTSEYFTAIATLLARRITALLKPQCKVIAVDCDNTLWKGICGEDGAASIEVTPAHVRFQQMLVRQHDAGVLLCLCSKNNESDVEAVFRSRPEMPLREDHFICSRVNWNSKSSNLESISQELGLSLDSFVLIDDSAIECAEVQTHCPLVLVLEFPQTTDEIEHFVDHVWAFDRVGVTDEAKQRVAQYKQNRRRSRALKETANLTQFLATLELQVHVTPMQKGQLSRVAELVQRTNQFNLSTIRRNSSEIESLWASRRREILVVHVKDRFGDYGLVGAIFLHRVSSAMDVDTFVLSCRVLGRGVEHRVANELGSMGRQGGLNFIVFRYRPTSRNVPARNFLERAFAQFRLPTNDDNQFPSEGVFKIPVEYAVGLRAEALTDDAASESGTPSDASSIAVPTLPTHSWHYAAYRLSRLADIVRGIGRSAVAGQRTRDDSTAPGTPTESAIAEIWAEVLGLEEIDLHADFFDLGGDSLLAVQVIARIGSVLGAELSVYEFFEGPTVAQIADRLTSASQSKSQIQRADRTQPLYLSWGQQRLWFIDLLEGGSPAYHLPLAIRLRGTLDRRALRAALDALVQRHEALRTVFVRVDGDPVQQINSNVCFQLQLVELGALPTEQREVEVSRQSQEEFSAPFDLGVGPLIRGKLLQLANDECVLLITMHHIISDGWSIGILIRELGALYEAFHEGRSDPLPPLPIQYADYAQWQRQWLTAVQLHEQLTYWRNHLQGAPELLELPTDRPRPAVQSYRGANVEVSLGSDATEALKDFTRRHNLTLAMTLYAAWAIVLSRISGQADLVVGIPVANRQRTEVEGLVGFFVNTLAVRVHLEDDLQVVDLLQRVKQIMLGAYAHQDLPFEQVVEALQPARSLSHSPIFQVMLTLQNAPAGILELSGIKLMEQEVPLQMAQFDLALCLQESARGISGILNYASDLFDVATVERWVECFKTVLREMVSQPQRPVSRLPLMRDDERRRIVELFNETQVAYPTGKLIHELFQEQVERAPEALALTYGERQLTYRQLNSRANRLAHALSARGLRPDERVALCMARGVEMIIGLLGILKAGGAYVPLDGSYPAERLRFMVEDSAPIIVITQEALKDVLPTGDIPVVVLDMDSDEIREKPDTNVMAARIGLRPQHLASIIYTSGSTGRPKGVMVEHAGLCNLAYMQMQSFDVQPGSRVLQFASLSFDACTWECLMALCSGACLCIASREELAPGEPLLRTLRAQNVTHATLPPVALAALPEGSDLRLKTLIVAGEPCPVSLAQKWGSGRCFINAYGPTEATVCASIHQYAPSDSGSLPIGRPIPNTQIYILDKHDQPVPIGVIGEIHIGGVGVTRGYWNRTELTSQRFVGDPFRGNGSGRMYRTGDLGRWRIDGTIEFVGRNDHQVKLRGFRIELGEIEVQLLRHTQVKEAVVVAREDVQNDKRLVAYVVVNRTSGSQMALSVEDLRMHLATVLPEHMIPSAFVMLEAVPLTPNGKVNRQALPVPGSTAYVRQYYEPPLGNEEQVLAGIWQSLLRVERIGRHDNFFELGGHSLLATRVVARIRELLHVELPLKALFETPKLAQLAARIAAEVHGQAANEALRASSLGQEIGDMPDDAVFAKIADLERELGYSDQ